MSKDFLVWVPFDGPVRRWTRAQFLAEARGLAAGLQRAGVAERDRIAVVLPNSPDFLLAWTAITMAGATAVCLNPLSSKDEVSYYVIHSDISGAFGSVDVPGVRFVDLPPGDPLDFRPVPPVADRPMSIQYTSGTTARPKAVVWTAANCRFAGRVGAAHQRLSSSDVYLVHLPLFHTNALSYSFLSIVDSGATMVLQPKFSASRFWDVSVSYGCTWTSVVSFCLRSLAGRPAGAHKYRGWASSSVVAPGTGPGGVGATGWFGMTETVSHPICSDPLVPSPPGTMGRPAPEYRVRVVEDGLLQVYGIRGESLFSEYLGDAAATEAAFTEDGWFRTGDRVRVEDDGSYTFVERDKDVLKVAGENVGAPEIERALLTVPGIREAAVVGRPDDLRGEVPVAFVLSVDDVVEAARKVCEEMLPPYKRPVEIRVLSEFPRSTLEKVAKAQLRKLL
jgi:crotonobetaine/carnitine-CoA ligase